MSALRLASYEPLSHEIEIKKSRFLTFAKRVNCVDDAREYISQIKETFPDARHHCSAFVVSIPGANDVLHSSDDGEPSGTAGRPMLDILTGFQLTDTVVVVVRYFGGTLLGTGGLVRAYSDSVRECLIGAHTVTQAQLQCFDVTLSHASAGKTEAELRARGYDVVGIDYHNTHVTLRLATSNIDSFMRDLAEISSGEASAHKAGTVIREHPSQPL
ncbi:YigZ family protein [Arcanobacterium bovis]|uniref:YigZ family protein n=1 Tax=Arcanobacterium bovis TaxID=2529275 RepID=A0A4Q9UYX9_9ACTO|nr:YigZ family protein [Arcanobacterium bovis]TBW20942.1 YigZ family protein [Arcanobacterium bovis]